MNSPVDSERTMWSYSSISSLFRGVSIHSMTSFSSFPDWAAMKGGADWDEHLFLPPFSMQNVSLFFCSTSSTVFVISSWFLSLWNRNLGAILKITLHAAKHLSFVSPFFLGKDDLDHFFLFIVTSMGVIKTTQRISLFCDVISFKRGEEEKFMLSGVRKQECTTEKSKAVCKLQTFRGN